MSLIFNKYEHRLDKCWYDSSTVIYSECDDNKNDYKDLRITFKDGRTYLYKKVSVQDYLLFRENVSQGKALNKYITKKVSGKNKYDYEKIEDCDVDIIDDELDMLLEEKEINLNNIDSMDKNNPEDKIEISVNNLDDNAISVLLENSIDNCISKLKDFGYIANKIYVNNKLENLIDKIKNYDSDNYVFNKKFKVIFDKFVEDKSIFIVNDDNENNKLHYCRININ